MIHACILWLALVSRGWGRGLVSDSGSVLPFQGEPGYLGPQGEPGLPGLPGLKVIDQVGRNRQRWRHSSPERPRGATTPANGFELWIRRKGSGW